jgi:hypothetical protein
MLKLTIRNRTKVHDLNDKPTSIAALVVLSFIPVLHSQANHCYQSHTLLAITKDVRRNVGEGLQGFRRFALVARYEQSNASKISKYLTLCFAHVLANS